jgi:hypothetical protein
LPVSTSGNTTQLRVMASIDTTQLRVLTWGNIIHLQEITSGGTGQLWVVLFDLQLLITPLASSNCSYK